MKTGGGSSIMRTGLACWARTTRHWSSWSSQFWLGAGSTRWSHSCSRSWRMKKWSWLTKSTRWRQCCWAWTRFWPARCRRVSTGHRRRSCRCWKGRRSIPWCWIWTRRWFIIVSTKIRSRRRRFWSGRTASSFWMRWRSIIKLWYLQLQSSNTPTQY